jgi:hypothetical protein
MKLIPAIILAALLSACGDSPPNKAYVKQELTVEGCTVKKIYNPGGPDFFMARCPGAPTATVSYQAPNGKSSTLVPAITIENLDKVKEEVATVEAREAALKKLSPSERELLGLGAKP